MLHTLINPLIIITMSIILRIFHPSHISNKLKIVINIVTLLLIFDLTDCVKKCSPNCVNCFPGGFGACNQCNVGYFVSAGKCLTCSSKMGCTSCDGVICNSCATGFYITSSYSCQLCSNVAHCTTCFSISGMPFCSTCVQGFVVNSTLPQNGCQ
jgi:hypothetical protein